ncbi:MAG: hypothetical protein WAM82_21870 [Thermoanaerobaculia bacterium]
MSSFASLLLSFFMALAPRAVAAPAEPPAFDPGGRWEGAIIVRPGEFELDLQLMLEPCAKGGQCGHLALPTENSGPLEVLDLQVQGHILSFRTRDAAGTVSNFRGTASGDGKSVEGIITEAQSEAPFTLSRASGRSPEPSAVEILSSSGAELRDAFNHNRDKVRLVLILSPTCSNCRMSARMVQRYVLQPLDDSRLAVFVIWEKIGVKDTLETARQATALLPDSRVRFFWSEARAAGKAFQGPIGIQGTPAWDVFLVYDPGKNWIGDAPPVPSFFMHNQPSHSELPQDRLLNGNRLADKIRSTLHPIGAP